MLMTMCQLPQMHILYIMFLAFHCLNNAMTMRLNNETYISRCVHHRLDLPFAGFGGLHLNVGSHFVLYRKQQSCLEPVRQWMFITINRALTWCILDLAASIIAVNSARWLAPSLFELLFWNQTQHSINSELYTFKSTRFDSFLDRKHLQWSQTQRHNI